MTKNENPLCTNEPYRKATILFSQFYMTHALYPTMASTTYTAY
jgi:hypothetical protein